MSGFDPFSMISGGIGGAFQYAGAKKQADAMEQSAKLQTEAAKHGADLEDAANRRSTQFQRELAQQYGEQAEIDRHANYDQAAASLQRLGSIGQLLGIKGVSSTMPAYVPGVKPNFVAPSVADAVDGRYLYTPQGGAPRYIDPVGGAPSSDLTPMQLAELKKRMGGNPGAVPMPSVGSYL
jgi:hypothetical protein